MKVKMLTKSNEVTGADLKIGDCMLVTEPRHQATGQTVLQTYDRLISLDNPELSWVSDTSLKGIKLQSGDKIELTVE